ncbi:MAG: TonB-dependent receptor [Bdellovibrionales bacterium]|nr:TonB-dependent receptor [Bdellovibrionales bacterium]
MMIFSLLVSALIAVAQTSSTQTSPTTTPPGAAPATEQLPPSTQENIEATQMKKITVTGSYIKRVDEEGPSPVKTIGKDQLDKSGNNSVADALRDSAISNGASRENSISGAANAGASTVSIRGFGSDDILLLLNGQRLPKIGGGNSVDTNIIPPAALERVEILKDGASALYGSDAMGGVMNFITKKDYNGANINFRHNQPRERGGARTDVSAVIGRANEKASIMGVINIKNNEKMFDRDREFSRITDLRRQGSPIGSPGSWDDLSNGAGFNPGSTADPCPPGQLLNLGTGQVCAFNTANFSASLPDIQQVSGLVSGRYNFTPNVKAKVDAIYVRREVTGVLAPGPDRLRMNAAQAAAVGLPGTGDVLAFYRTAEEFGNRISENINNTYIIQPSLDMKIGTWDLELSAAYGRNDTRSDNIQGYARREALMALIDNGTWKPFAAPGAKGNVSSAAYRPWQEIATTQATVKAIGTGQLYKGGEWFGPLAMAVGASADRQDYKEKTDPLAGQLDANQLNLVYGGGAGANGSGSRNFQSVFTEFNYFATDSIETGLAFRYDKFSDFGDTFNPKLSLSWQANERFLYRASVGTGFKAPNLNDLYSGPTNGNPTFVDRKACAAGIPGTCAPRQWNVRSGGNRNLKEERSIFYSAGVVIQPKRNWNVSLDGFYAVIRDRVRNNRLFYTYLTEADRLGINLTNYGITTERNADGTIAFIQVPTLNLATDKTSGFDLSISNEAKTSIFNKPLTIQTSFDHQQIIYNKQEPFPGTGKLTMFNLNWRNVMSVAFVVNDHRLRFAARTFPGADKEANNGALGRVGFGSTYIFTEWDLDYTLANVFKGTMSAGVRNLFNSTRPLDDSQSNPYNSLDTSIYDPVGQVFYLGYSYNF